MVAAIAFIVAIGFLFAVISTLYSKTTQRTIDHFLHNQQELLARSAVEYAVLAAGGHDYTNNCLNTILIDYANSYDIRITIHYIGNDLPADCYILDKTLSDPRDNGTAIIDVRVTLDPSVQDGQPTITYARRLIQKL